MVDLLMLKENLKSSSSKITRYILLRWKTWQQVARKRLEQISV